MQTVINGTKDKMQRRVNHLEEEYSGIRAGRANPAVLDKVTVDYYGTPTPVNQVAAVSIAEARTLVVQPWDTFAKGSRKEQFRCLMLVLTLRMTVRF